MLNNGKKENRVFSEQFKKRAEKMKYPDPKSIAEALDKNVELREIIMPGKRSDTKSDYDENGERRKYKATGTITSPEARRQASILRNVQKHWKVEDAKEIPGKYMYAYSKLLECSIDYLFGLTGVPTSDIDVRGICEKTGLNEKAVNNLIEERLKREDIDGGENYYWSSILESSLFRELPRDWKEAEIQALRAVGNEHNLKVIRDLKTSGADKEVSPIKTEAKTEYDIYTYNAAYEGILYRLYRRLVNHIEEEIAAKCEEDREWLASLHGNKTEPEGIVRIAH